MSSEDLFSEALKGTEEVAQLPLPNDDVDTGVLSSSSSDSEEVEGKTERSSSSEEDSDDQSEEDSDDQGTKVALEEEDDEEISPEGAIRSKHEIEQEPIPDLPEDYEIDPNAVITEIGVIKSAFENNIIIHTVSSGERRVLKEGAILCLQDRTIIGTLCEVFGKLDNPFYRVTLPASRQAQFDKLKNHLGEKAHIVVPEAHWVDTFELRRMKGTDASNGYDEELSEDEQEFSDDEKEALFKKLRKEQRKKKNVNVKDLREQVEAGIYKKPKQQHFQKQSQQYPKVRPPVGMINHGYRSRDSRQEARSHQAPQAAQYQTHSIPQQTPPSIPQSIPQPSFQQPMYQQASPPAQQPVYYHQSPQMYATQQYASPPVPNPGYQGPPPPFYNMQYGQQTNPALQHQMYPAQSYNPHQSPPPQTFQQYGASGYAAPPQVQSNMQQVLQLHSLLMQQQSSDQSSNGKKEFNYDD